MNHDQYDDLYQYDDIEDDEDVEDEHPDIVPDGGRVRVPISMMDSVQKSVAEARWDNHKPGWRVPDHVSDAVEDAHRDYCAWLRGAHRAPVTTNDASAAARLTTNDLSPRAHRRPTSLADAQAAAEAAYEERCEWLRNAHRERRP